MYELTCPSCKHVRRFAFIRIGARSVCTQCKQAFVIKTDYFSRTACVSIETGSGDRDPLTAVEAPTPPPPTQNSGVIGLPGRAMGQVASAKQAAGLTTGLPVGAAASADAAGAANLNVASSPLGNAGETALPFTSTAVPTAAAGNRNVPPVSRLIAAKIRQKRRRQLVAWLTLVGVVLLFGVIAAMLVGLNRGQPSTAGPSAAVAVPPQTITLYRVGPPQWVDTDEVAYSTTHSGPLVLQDYGVVPVGHNGDFLLVGTVVCTSFDLFDMPRLQLLLTDGANRIFAKADVSLPPMSGQRETARQHISMAIPRDLHDRLSTVDWEAIPGQPLNDGLMVPPDQVVALGKNKETQLKIIYQNRLSRPIYKLSLSIRPADANGRPLVHWIGQWKGLLRPGQTLDLLLPTPLPEALPDIADWQVRIAADQATIPAISPPDDDDTQPAQP